MATDMQPFLKGLLSPGNRPASETRDRNAGLQASSSENRFGSILGTAQARGSGLGHEAMSLRSRQIAHSQTSPRATTHSQIGLSSKNGEIARHDRSATPTEQMQPSSADDSDEGQEEQNTKAPDKSTQESTLSPEMLVAAGLTPQSRTDDEVSAHAPSDAADAPAAVEAMAGRVLPSEQSLGVRSTIAGPPARDTQSASAAPSSQTPTQTSTDKVSNDATDRSAESTKVPDAPDTKSLNAEAELPVKIQNQDVLNNSVTVLNEGSLQDAQTEAKAKVAIAVSDSQLTRKTASRVDAVNQNALQSSFDSIVQETGASAVQPASSAEQHMGQEYQSSSESKGGPDHRKSNIPPTDDLLRPQFLDPATGVSSSAPSSGDYRVARGESGQAAVIHTTESERITELRGASSLTQSVTVDLEPLDMGSLRVRVMMTDQTVHAHIRTEHGELGQSLLQQGPSLESSLRTTGLEMGMLRVTVDQQQQGRGENAWAFQQQQGRPGLASATPPATREEEQAWRTEHSLSNNGRLSFFA